MAAEEDFVLSFTGEETDNLLKHTESMKNQTTEEDGETVQVYDTNGVPHKVSKTELLKKSTLALPALEDISSFVAVNAAGNAVGVMTKEQVASVLAELMGAVLLKGVTKSDLDNGLTSPSHMIVMFVSGYINQITPTANYISGYAVRYTSLNTEMQVVVDYAGKLYSRTKNLSDGSWTVSTASYNLYAYIISSSFTLSIVKGQDGNGLIKINRA